MLLDGLERVLRRPKFHRYMDEQVAREFVERVRRQVTVVDDSSEQPPVTRERDDDYLVTLALGAGSMQSSAATGTSSMWCLRHLWCGLHDRRSI